MQVDMYKKNTLLTSEPLYGAYEMFLSLKTWIKWIKSNFLKPYGEVGRFWHIVLEPGWAFLLSTPGSLILDMFWFLLMAVFPLFPCFLVFINDFLPFVFFWHTFLIDFHYFHFNLLLFLIYHILLKIIYIYSCNITFYFMVLVCSLSEDINLFIQFISR